MAKNDYAHGVEQDRQKQFGAFDKAPKATRVALQNASVNWSPLDVQKYWNNRPASVAQGEVELRRLHAEMIAGTQGAKEAYFALCDKITGR